METSTPTSPPLLPKTNNIGASIFLFLGLLGFGDAAFLYFEHLRGVLPTCSIITGCGQVLLSRFATVGPLPIALLGTIYYALIIGGSLYYFDSKKIGALRVLSIYSIAGLLASIYFIFLQIFVIKALCMYCLLSALTSTLIFVNGVFVYRKTN